MGYEVHKKVLRGRTRYRVWSTSWDGYMTPEMDENELKEYILVQSVHDTVESIMQSFRLGGSYYHEGKVARWQKGIKIPEDNDPDLRDAHVERIGAEVLVKSRKGRARTKIVTVTIKPVKKR
jgi:hypothetical protein